MPQEDLKTHILPDSPKFERIFFDSPGDDDEMRPEITHPGSVTDLSFLSLNFSSQSLPNDVIDSAPSTPLEAHFTGTPVAAAGNSAFEQTLLPCDSKRMSFHDNSASLTLSPSAPVGQPSFSHNQRAGLASAGPRSRLKSFLGPESSNIPIWETAKDPVLLEMYTMNPQSDVERPRNRGCALFSPIPRAHMSVRNVNFPPPASEPRTACGSPSLNTSRNTRNMSPIRRQNMSPFRYRASSPSKKQPFNFQPQDLSMPSLPSTSPSLVEKPAHRKGHRYKHSSVSMNLFQEPLPIAETNHQQNLIPDLHPIPNFKECFGSASKPQKLKIGMSLVHCMTSVAVFVTGVHTLQPAFSTLAHLIFYDSLGSLTALCVDVMSNFEVWGKSSIAYPFGLGRLEVLLSFALSTSLVMVGCDLISHFVEELVLGLVDSSLGATTEHGAHHIHGPEETGASGWLLYEAILLAVIAVTWFTSTYIIDQTSLLELMTKSDRKLMGGKEYGLLDSRASASQWNLLVQRFKSILKILVNNPIRSLTLVYSSFLLVVPLIPENLKEEFGFDLNESSTLVVASLLCYAGWNLVKTLGGILLISFPYSDYDFSVAKASIYDRILNLGCFKTSYSIEKLHFTKANPTLYLAGVLVRMAGGSSDDESRLVFEINRIIVDTMKNFESDCRVESTISAKRV